MSPPGVAPTHPLLSIATPSRDVTPLMTYTTTKGLLNEPGQNNCFLNSAVQVLWHLDIFRRSFRDLMGHACMADSCIFCALKELFSQLQFSNESALPPDALRKALAESFSDQQRFQLGFMDDAAECFENILLRIHMHIAHGESQDMCNAKHCIPHQKFAMTLVEQTVCGSCGATSEPLSYTQMVHYVSTSTLVYQVRNGGNRSPNAFTSFGQLLRKAGNMGDVRMCPSQCGSVIQISRTLMNWPEIVSIGLVWNSERPSLEHIMEVFASIGTTMLLGDVFNSVLDKRWTETCTHNLVGVVTYYGKHYSTFFFHTKLRVWIYFDDATVRQVGPHWEQVVEKCRKGRYQPLLLLYATPDGTPVNTENAPKQITQLYPQKSIIKNAQPTHSLLRRSVTPSPEKPTVNGNTRRAITPNPDGMMNQKPPLPKPYNDYQNLAVIQSSLKKNDGGDVVDGCALPYKEPEYVTRKALDFGCPKLPISVHRTLSNGSSSGMEGISDHMNILRRRDSGNWSGDRNSASSSSSTTMENPYLYLVGKVPQHGNVPESPTMLKSDSSSGGSVIYDAGYDSYSLSSNDSSTMTTIQHMMKIGHLAKIPEDYNNTSQQISQSCDVLCDEADELLIKSRQLEDEHDLVLALALCNAAATKARAAMNAPYNNPQTLTLARMKHNTCIMRARSLHRRMTQVPQTKDSPIEIRHTREGSSGSGRHSRQNSRDKGNHSRQNSKELLVLPQPDKHVPKSIEIYATLPKKKDLLKSRMENITIDDKIDYISVEKPIKESRSIFSRSKQKDSQKKEKRSRSEDRTKRLVEFAPPQPVKEIKTKVKEEKEEKKDKDGKNKKQHKIRRKLLMGGLIKRKNRSMPDLTDAKDEIETNPHQINSTSVDDSSVGLKGKTDDPTAMSGYLSEGHLEFTANNANPKLKKSKLMRKNFYASAGKILAAKVPPPPPLRTTSQLSKSKLNCGKDFIREYQQQDCNDYVNNLNLSNISSTDKTMSSDDSFLNSSLPGGTTLVTKADVHREQRKSLENLDVIKGDEFSRDEIDCMPNRMHLTNDLPPYPSPMGSVNHSRQASEEFPPPPPPLDLSSLDEYLPKASSPKPLPPPPSDSLLSQLQNRKQQIFSGDTPNKQVFENTSLSSGEGWLRELQAKQAALRIKRQSSFNVEDDQGRDVVNTEKYTLGEIRVSSVKDLTTKFEVKPEFDVKTQLYDNNESKSLYSEGRKCDIDTIGAEQIAEEIREVERINATLQETLNCNKVLPLKNKPLKKKSVSFCDQVILVATAEDQEEESYIPNPILERVLRSGLSKNDNENWQELKDSQLSNAIYEGKYKPSVRKNSIENLLNPLMNAEYKNPGTVIVNPMQMREEHYQTQQLPSRMTHSQNAQSYYHQNSTRVPQQQGYENQIQYGTTQQDGTVNQNGTIQQHGIIQQNGTTQQNGTIQQPSTVQQNVVNQQNGHLHNPQAQGYPNEPAASYHTPPQSQIYHNNVQQNHYASSQNGYPQNRVHSTNYYPHTQLQQSNSYPNSSQSYPNSVQHHSAASTNNDGCHYNQYATSYQSNYSPNNSQNFGDSQIYSGSPQNNYPQYSTVPYSNNSSQNIYSVGHHQPTNVHSSNSNYGTKMTPSSSPSVRQSPNITQHGIYGQQLRQYYQHTPSSTSNQSGKQTPQLTRSQSGIYQSVPFPVAQIPNGVNPVYQRVPVAVDQGQNYSPYQRLPARSPHTIEDPPKGYDTNRVPYDRNPYQQVPQTSTNCFQGQNNCDVVKKSVTFEDTVMHDMPISKAVVTPILVNNANNSIPDKTKCNLCRKKIVALSNLYCVDCEYYMSRFKPKS